MRGGGKGVGGGMGACEGGTRASGARQRRVYKNHNDKCEIRTTVKLYDAMASPERVWQGPGVRGGEGCA